MGDKGIKVRISLVAVAGVVGTEKAVFHVTMLKTAPGDSTGLVAFSSPAAGAMASQVHGTQATVEATERKEQILSIEIFHEFRPLALKYYL